MAATRVRGRGVGGGEKASGRRRGTEPSGARLGGIQASAVTLRYGTAAAAGEIWSRVAR